MLTILVATFLTTSCGNNCDELNSQIAQLQQDTTNLRAALNEAPTKAIEAYKEEQQRLADSAAASAEALGLNLIKLESITKKIDPYAISALRAEDQFQYLGSSVANFLGSSEADLKVLLSNPAIISAVFNANKDVLPQVLDKTGLRPAAQRWTAILLPYLNGTSKNIQIFNAFYAKYGNYKEDLGDYSYSTIPRNTEEWAKMEASTGLDRARLNNEYWAYLCAKRLTDPKWGGSAALNAEIVKILTVVKAS